MRLLATGSAIGPALMIPGNVAVRGSSSRSVKVFLTRVVLESRSPRDTGARRSGGVRANDSRKCRSETIVFEIGKSLLDEVGDREHLAECHRRELQRLLELIAIEKLQCFAKVVIVYRMNTEL